MKPTETPREKAIREYREMRATVAFDYTEALSGEGPLLPSDVLENARKTTERMEKAVRE